MKARRTIIAGLLAMSGICLAYAVLATVGGPRPARAASDLMPIGEARRKKADTIVQVQGVVYACTMGRNDKGDTTYGFFLQNTVASADADPATSDGIFVYQGRYRTFKGGYKPAPGDEIVVEGKHVKYFGQAQLTSLRLIKTLRTKVDLDTEVPAFDANPPDDSTAAGRYWESHEGMRAKLPAGCIALGPRNSRTATAEAELWVARPDSTIALRPAGYARRSFRDTHPLDNVSDKLFDDGNGYRIVLGSDGLKGAGGDSAIMLAPVRSFDTITSALTGGVGYRFGKYIIDVTTQITVAPGLDPALNNPPTAPDRATEYSIATYNIENLYDFRDDPFDPCDFAGNPGLEGVEPPFDYVPANEGEYRGHLARLAQSIVSDLHSPDIMLLQEAEDQDIGTMVDGKMSYGATNNADGKPDTVQELALAIKATGGPVYDAAYDRDGADTRGITCAFLYRTDRVQLVPPAATDPLLGKNPQPPGAWKPLAYNVQVQNPKALNAENTAAGEDGEAATAVFPRAPQVALFHITPVGKAADAGIDIYLIDNHFTSGPDRRVPLRRNQAAFSAALLSALQLTKPDVRAIAGGDFNVFPRPDDPFTPAAKNGVSDQLKPFYAGGFFNLYDVLLKQDPASAYTYVHDGMAQTLDQLYNTRASYAALKAVRVAHINSDWPDAAPDAAVSRRTSDHDPVVATYTFSLPPLDK